MAACVPSQAWLASAPLGAGLLLYCPSAQSRLSAPADYMAEARNVFRNPATTEFVIVTIPTAMAAAESIRLAKALRKEQARGAGPLSGWGVDLHGR